MAIAPTGFTGIPITCERCDSVRTLCIAKLHPLAVAIQVRQDVLSGLGFSCVVRLSPKLGPVSIKHPKLSCSLQGLLNSFVPWHHACLMPRDVHCTEGTCYLPYFDIGELVELLWNACAATEAQVISRMTEQAHQQRQGLTWGKLLHCNRGV